MKWTRLQISRSRADTLFLSGQKCRRARPCLGDNLAARQIGGDADHSRLRIKVSPQGSGGELELRGMAIVVRRTVCVVLHTASTAIGKGNVCGALNFNDRNVGLHHLWG